MVFRFLVLSCALFMLQPFELAQAQSYVAGSTEWRPFNYTDESGHLRGVAIDIARQVFKRANIEVQFVSYPVNRLQAMLDRGQIDLNYAESTQWVRPQKAGHFVFSIPYLSVQEHLYFAADDPLYNTPVSELQNVTIGMVRGYIYRVLDPALQDKRITRLETSQDSALLQLLLNKRVNAVAMVDDLYNEMIANHQIDPAQFRQGALLNEAPLAIMLLSRHAALLPQINAAIMDMQRSGEVQRIREAYLPIQSAKTCHAVGESC